MLEDREISVILWQKLARWLCRCEDRVVQRRRGLSRMTITGSAKMPKLLKGGYVDLVGFDNGWI